MANLTIADRRMLQLPTHLKAVGKIEYTKDYIEILGMNKQNYYAIAREGWQHFTVAQILIVVKKYRVDPRWIFGLQSDTPFLGSNKKSNKTVRKSLKTLLYIIPYALFINHITNFIFHA